MLLGKGMEISLRCGLGLGLSLGLVQWWGLWVGLGLGLGLLLLLYLDLLWLVVGVVLELGGRCSVLTEATGLSCTVDLAQSVQGLALSVLQQVGLALRVRQKRVRQRERHRFVNKTPYQILKQQK